MTTNNHTLGPWSFGKDEHYSAGFRREIVSDGGVVAIVECFEGDYSDAHLIAAAPDLLAACRAALDFCVDSFLENNFSVEDNDIVLMKLRSAIEKAISEN